MTIHRTQPLRLFIQQAPKTVPCQTNRNVQVLRCLMINGKHNKKKRVTVADQEKKPLGKLVGAPRVRKKVYYVGGIDPACTAEDLTQYCEDSCPILDCRLMPSRRSGTWSAYVQVAEDLSHRFDSINWPENMYARPWTFDERHPIRSETMKVQCN